jgi:hypothetical protein
LANDSDSVDAKAYNKVVGRASIRSILLTASHFDMKPDALEVDPSQWRNAIDPQVSEVIASVDSERLYGLLSFEVVCRHRRRRVLSTSGRYLVTYHVNGGCDPELGAVFIRRVGLVAAYPYFRAMVAGLVSQAGVQMPPLPILSFAPRGLGSARNLEPLPTGMTMDDPALPDAPPRGKAS